MLGIADIEVGGTAPSSARDCGHLSEILSGSRTPTPLSTVRDSGQESPSWGMRLLRGTRLTLPVLVVQDSANMPAASIPISAGASSRGPGRLLPVAFLWTWVTAFLVILAVRGSVLVDAWAKNWPDLIFWLVLVMFVDLFPVAVGERSLTLDLPLLLATAFLFPPEAAASVALVGALDRREFAGEVSPKRAVLNRIQIAASVLAAGYVFHSLAGAMWWRTLLAVVLALVTDYLVNIVLVTSITIYRWLGTSEASVRKALLELRIGSWYQFALSYLAYGTLAFGLSRLYENPGAWSVVTLLTPIVIARQAMRRTQELERTTRELQTQKHLLARVFDQIVEERRDERRLIAGELHDDVLQHVLHTQLAALTLADGRSLKMATARKVREVVEASRAASLALRQVIQGLRSSPLGREGLIPALVQLLTTLRNEWGCEIESVLPDGIPLTPDAQLVAYQGAHEGLLNALKHSRASSISLTVVASGAFARLIIQDNGEGIDSDAWRDESSFGLALLRERVTSVGGEMTIDSHPGQGTRLELRFPLEPRSDGQ